MIYAEVQDSDKLSHLEKLKRNYWKEEEPETSKVQTKWAVAVKNKNKYESNNRAAIQENSTNRRLHHAGKRI